MSSGGAESGSSLSTSPPQLLCRKNVGGGSACFSGRRPKFCLLDGGPGAAAAASIQRMVTADPLRKQRCCLKDARAYRLAVKPSNPLPPFSSSSSSSARFCSPGDSDSLLTCPRGSGFILTFDAHLRAAGWCRCRFWCWFWCWCWFWWRLLLCADPVLSSALLSACEWSSVRAPPPCWPRCGSRKGSLRR